QERNLPSPVEIELAPGLWRNRRWGVGAGAKGYGRSEARIHLRKRNRPPGWLLEWSEKRITIVRVDCVIRIPDIRQQPRSVDVEAVRRHQPADTFCRRIVQIVQVQRQQSIPERCEGGRIRLAIAEQRLHVRHAEERLIVSRRQGPIRAVETGMVYALVYIPQI